MANYLLLLGVALLLISGCGYQSEQTTLMRKELAARDCSNLGAKFLQLTPYGEYRYSCIFQIDPKTAIKKDKK